MTIANTLTKLIGTNNSYIGVATHDQWGWSLGAARLNVDARRDVWDLAKFLRNAAKKAGLTIDITNQGDDSLLVLIEA